MCSTHHKENMLLGWVAPFSHHYQVSNLCLFLNNNIFKEAQIQFTENVSDFFNFSFSLIIKIHKEEFVQKMMSIEFNYLNIQMIEFIN